LVTGIFVTFHCYVLEIMSYVHHRSNSVYANEVLMHTIPVLRIHKTIVERTIMCSGMVEIYQCFRGTCCPHLHDGRV